MIMILFSVRKDRTKTKGMLPSDKNAPSGKTVLKPKAYCQVIRMFRPEIPGQSICGVSEGGGGVS